MQLELGRCSLPLSQHYSLVMGEKYARELGGEPQENPRHLADNSGRQSLTALGSQGDDHSERSKGFGRSLQIAGFAT